jgi:hypothetical protein
VLTPPLFTPPCPLMDDLSALVERVRELASAGARVDAAEALEELAAYGCRQCATPDDGATVLVTAATLAADLGMRRKRTLFLWRAATLAKHDPARSLALLTALAPPLDSTAPQPLAAWPALQRGVLWEALTRATRCADAPKAWDLAARLLNHHCTALSPTMQAALVRALHAASALFPPEESGGREAPPPGVTLVAVKPLPRHRRPLPADGASTGAAPTSVFVFSPFERTRALAVEKQQAETAVVEWVVGEPCAITVSLSNPTAVALRLDGLALVTDQPGGWEPQGGGDVPGGGSMSLPPHCTGYKVTLFGVPTLPGQLTFTGVAIDAFGGVWHAPWQDTRRGAVARAATAVALPPMPLLLPRLDYGGGDAAAVVGTPAMLPRTSSGGAVALMRRVSSTASGQDADLPPGEGSAMHTPPASPLRVTPASVSRRVSSSSVTPASAVKGGGQRPTPTATSSRIRRSRSALFGSTTSLAALGQHDASAPWMEEGHRAPPLSVSAYQGQVTPLSLVLHNCGPVSATRVEVSCAGMLQTPHFGDVGSGGGDTSSGIEVDCEALNAALPIPPGGYVTVPLVWHGRSRGSRGGHGDVAGEVRQHTLSVTCRYRADRSSSSPGSSPEQGQQQQQQQHARECRAELACSVLPGLCLVGTALRHVTGGGATASILQLDVRNAAQVPMAVRHCDVAEGMHGAARLLSACVDAAPPSDWHILPPGTDARLLVPSHTTALMWRCDVDGTCGWVPGIAQAVALLAPPTHGVAANSTLRPVFRCTGPGVLGNTWSSGDDGACGSVRLGSGFALLMSLSGDSMQPAPSDKTYTLRLSLRIHAADGTCVCPGPSGEEGQRSAVRLAWTGTPTATWRAPLADPPPEHPMQLLFLAPGVYTLLLHAQQTGEQGDMQDEAWLQAHLQVVEKDC